MNAKAFASITQIADEQKRSAVESAANELKTHATDCHARLSEHAQGLMTATAAAAREATKAATSELIEQQAETLTRCNQQLQAAEQRDASASAKLTEAHQEKAAAAKEKRLGKRLTAAGTALLVIGVTLISIALSRTSKPTTPTTAATMSETTTAELAKLRSENETLKSQLAETRTHSLQPDESAAWQVLHPHVVSASGALFLNLTTLKAPFRDEQGRTFVLIGRDPLTHKTQ